MSENTFPVGIEFDSVFTAISKQIYETPLAFLRENVQNAVDAVRIQAQREERNPGDCSYHIDLHVDGSVCTIQDNGIGMSSDDLRKYFWTMGASGKRNEEARRAGCVGMFGIGGFANFGVCSKLEVISQTEGATMGELTSLTQDDLKAAHNGLPLVKSSPSDKAKPRGTIVVGHLSQPANVSELNAYLKDFVRFARERVIFNGILLSGEDPPKPPALSMASESSWTLGNVTIKGRMAVNGKTIIGELISVLMGSTEANVRGILRLESGGIDVLKRGFKLCATKLVTRIPVSGYVDSDQVNPTAGRDSLDASSMSLLSQIAVCFEREAVLFVLRDSELLPHHTRIFQYVLDNNLVDLLSNLRVRLADDASETPLGDLAIHARAGRKVFFTNRANQTLSQVIRARGNFVVHLDGDHYKQRAELLYLQRNCAAQQLDGLVECTQRYSTVDRFERAFLSELEFIVDSAYEISNFQVIPGKLTEDIPAYFPENVSKMAEIFVDVRHQEIQKLRPLGLSSLLKSMAASFCSEYLGSGLRKRSPKYFGNGAINLELLLLKRSDLWILLKDDVRVISRGKRDVVRSGDVQVVRVGTTADNNLRIPKIIQIIDADNSTGAAGSYLRIPDSATKAFGDLIKACPYRGAVWVGNKILSVASDGVSSAFHFEVRLSSLIRAGEPARSGIEGASELAQPIQEFASGLYFPIPEALEHSLVPKGDSEVRLEVTCDWVDMETSRAWVARAST